MRKKTINFLFDSVLWYAIYLLPIIAFLIFLGHGVQEITILGAMQNIGLDILPTNDIFVTLNSIFGSNGVVPIFSNSDLLYYFAYFLCVSIIHLCVDFLLFIPKIAHEWLSKAGGNE